MGEFSRREPKWNEKASVGGRDWRRLGSETVSTKNGLSIVAVTMSSSLRDDCRIHRRNVLDMIGSL
jgi:hypothetical protein